MIKTRKVQKSKKRGKLTAKQIKKAVKAVKAKRQKKDVIQIKNPKTGLYCKIDRTSGAVLAYKKTKGKYKNIKVARNYYLRDKMNDRISNYYARS